MEKKQIKKSRHETVIGKTPTRKTQIPPRTRRNILTISSAKMDSSMQRQKPVKNDVNSSCGPSTSCGKVVEEETKRLDEVFDKFSKYLSPIDILRAQRAQLPQHYKKRIVVPDPTIQHRIRRISLMTSEDRAAREKAQNEIRRAQYITSPSPGTKGKKVIDKNPKSERSTVKKKTSDKANPLPEELFIEGTSLQQYITSPSPGTKGKKVIDKKPEGERSIVKKKTSDKAITEAQPNPLPEELFIEGLIIINVFKVSWRKFPNGPKRKRFIRKEVRKRAERRYLGCTRYSYRLPEEIISTDDSEDSKVSG